MSKAELEMIDWDSAPQELLNLYRAINNDVKAEAEYSEIEAESEVDELDETAKPQLTRGFLYNVIADIVHSSLTDELNAEHLRLCNSEFCKPGGQCPIRVRLIYGIPE